MKFKSLVIMFVFFGVITGCMLTFMVGSAVRYGQPTSEFIPSYVDVSEYEAEMISAQANASASEMSVHEDLPQLDVGSVLFMSIKGIGKTFSNIIQNVFNLIVGVIVNILHIPKIVVYAIMTILSITIAFGLWRVLKVGE